jgi:5-methyltetrahydrofolate--homocysteine methyltransferase
MVTPERIIAAAIEHVDILVGLITPSLDEMVYLAKELDKQNIKIHDWWVTTTRLVRTPTQEVIHVNDAERNGK